MNETDDRESWERWARLRFAIVGRLLAEPPAPGRLRGALLRLSRTPWRDPVDGETRTFAFSTLERWYYQCRNEIQDPVGVLRRHARKDAGLQPSVGADLRDAIRRQYDAHRGWTCQLHVDNLAALVAEDPGLGPLPSYPTIRRYMKAQGMFRRRRPKAAETEGAARAAARLDELEVRSFEAEHVHGLWHTDFHHGSRKVVTREGRWVTPLLLGVLDDASRIICHAQWYVDETAETFVHGLSQAFQKRGLPRALLHDNGSAMRALETQSGLGRLGVLSEPTLPYSPYQNGKQERFWSLVEGRLLPMLEGLPELSLGELNDATQAWVEGDYNRARHSELGRSPVDRLLAGPSVGRDSPSSETLRRAFKRSVVRTQRRTDGTISVQGRRFELPSRYRHHERVSIRYATWDLRSVELVDSREGTSLTDLYPLDKAANADGMRRRLEPNVGADDRAAPSDTQPVGMAPYLRQLMVEYAATGLPPAYIPKHQRLSSDPGEEKTP
jgi:transposase InsO family protein